MGALDFLKGFEGRVLDAASYQLLKRNYELQEENNRQLKEALARVEKENARLSSENEELEMKLANLAVEENFEIYEGFAFKRKADQTFDSHGYCPTCKVIMSYTALRTYQCPKCKYSWRTKVNPDVLARQLNS